MRTSRVAAVLLVVLATAGCGGPGTDASTTTAGAGTPAVTPLPQGSVDVPDGPKAPPERPDRLNRSSVREYVRTFEYRIAYNSLWINEYTEVTLACRVDSVSERSWGYEAVVTCTGHSNTDVPENATATPGPHGDWFTQSFRYRVSGNATHRRQVDPRDPVA
ncbi:MAG: hypothetical protein ABEH40_05190 [Haloferacaceae archaeon]